MRDSERLPLDRSLTPQRWHTDFLEDVRGDSQRWPRKRARNINRAVELAKVRGTETKAQPALQRLDANDAPWAEKRRFAGSVGGGDPDQGA